VRWQVHGASMMDLRSATRFKLHMEEAIRELSSAIVLLQETHTVEESRPVRKAVGDILAAIDTLLHESVYVHHPQLNEHSRK
jgi:hypothetical protein